MVDDPKVVALLADIRDEAWAALRVSTMNLTGIDDLLAEAEARELIETGMCFATAATMAYFKDRGWLNEEAME